MLHVIIVMDDVAAASSLAAILGHQQGYRVVSFAYDLVSAVSVARSSNVHIAFVDVDLASLDSGYRIADELNRLGITCVFVTRSAPPFPMPELAATWLEEPYTPETVSRSLQLASARLMAQARQPASQVAGTGRSWQFGWRSD